MADQQRPRTRAEAEAKAKTLVERWAAAAYLTGWIPGAALALTAADMVMIRQVAAAFGVARFDEEAVTAHLRGLAASGVGAVAAELVGTVPLVGWIMKSGTLGVKAKALGQAVIDYFRERSPLPE